MARSSVAFFFVSSDHNFKIARYSLVSKNLANGCYASIKGFVHEWDNYRSWN
jgi:hypothetical protein